MQRLRIQLLVIASLPFVLASAVAKSGHPDGGENPRAKQQEYLQQLMRVLPPSQPWEEWLRRTRELPPDFDSLPPCADLPDPLVRTPDGQQKPVRSAAEWQERRGELNRALQYWILGSVPPPPDEMKVEVLKEVDLGNAVDREVRLSFGPRHRAHLWLELMIPKGKGPFPVFLTQHNHRAWALIALRRGYLACVYAGSDSRDDTDSFLDEYPGYDWSRLTRRAWAASRCIDYLETVPQADTSKIAITGHSRNGKQSLIAAALDERIDVVISSSSGAGGSLTARLFSEQHFGEGIELITRRFPDWFHPRWRFFVGREHRLPVDLHELVALIAPRPCLLSTALNDNVESVWGIQHTYRSVKRVYEFLGAPDRIRILWREGSHETAPWVIERYLDWCDLHFGRGDFSFPEEFLYPADWEEWREESGVSIVPTDYPERAGDDFLLAPSGRRIRTWRDWIRMRNSIREAVLGLLGDEPPVLPNPGGYYGTEPDHVAALLRRSSPSPRPSLGTWLLSAEDIRDPHRFVSLLNAGETSAARHLWQMLPAGVRDELRSARQDESTTLRSLLSRSLNSLLVRDSLWVTLGEEAPFAEPRYAQLFSHVNDISGLARANRIILEELFPEHISPALMKRQIVFGEYINGDLAFPASAELLGRKLPTVLWLHPISSARGYVAGYMRGEQPYLRLARAGFAVFCYDQIGNGRRIREATEFYHRHPRWSLLGKMVRDARAALDVLPRFGVVDTSNIWVLGYATGAFLALHLAPIDDRPAGWVLVCPPPPFRLDTNPELTGGIARWSSWTMLLPQLGFFIGQENRIPYDVPELLACMAPKRVLVVTPQLDREAPPELIQKAIDAAREVFRLAGAEDHLVQMVPEDYNNFADRMQSIVVDWLRTTARSATQR